MDAIQGVPKKRLLAPIKYDQMTKVREIQDTRSLNFGQNMPEIQRLKVAYPHLKLYMSQQNKWLVHPYSGSKLLYGSILLMRI